MEEEHKNFIKVWVSAIISVSYCYYLSTRIKSGVFRLLSVLPVCALFLVLPLFSSSVHFSGSIAFFLSFLANFKLILLSFDQGPLFPLPPNLSSFISFTCFPIKTRESPKSQNHLPKWVFAIKVVIFDGLLYVYCQYYKQNPPPIVLLSLHSLQIYLEIEIILMLVKVVVFIFLGCDLEPHSNEPYLATSDFWGRRWNLMVPAILRPAVYTPIRKLAERKLNSDLAQFLGYLATFTVSGAIHELMFFYITREMPTGEVTMFFVLNGVCTAAEVVLKKKFARRRWRMSTVASRLLTVGFVVVTGGWLFFPPLVRRGMIERLAKEALLVNDLRGLVRSGFLIDVA